jgi:hypothetical protein
MGRFNPIMGYFYIGQFKYGGGKKGTIAGQVILKWHNLANRVTEGPILQLFGFSEYECEQRTQKTHMNRNITTNMTMNMNINMNMNTPTNMDRDMD